MKKLRDVFLGFLLCISIFKLFGCNPASVQKKDYQVTETYNIAAVDGAITYLSVNLPLNYGYQEIGNIEVTGAEEYTISEEDGYREFNAVINGSEIVTLVYSIHLSKGNVVWNNVMLDSYTQPAEFIDSDNDEIVKAAKSLIGSNDDETAKNIFTYVVKNIKFIRNGESDLIWTASDILKNKIGICKDYANLMTAMLRAAGIPAKAVNGLVLNDLKEPTEWMSSAQNGSHAWVEFYSGGEWHFADPTWGKRYFNNADGYHLSYGTEPMTAAASYREKISRIESDGYFIIGAMTAPLKFLAYSDDKNTAITPKSVIAEVH